MAFNLRAKRQKRLIEKLRSLSDDCAGLRPSDLDGMSENDMYYMYHDLKKTANVKIATHGHGETWIPVGNDYNPYKTSPLVNYQGPEFGGRWRRDMPGGGDNQINDDGDKQKNTKGDDSGESQNAKEDRVNSLIEGIRGPKYVVRLRLTEDEEPNDDKAKDIFGDDGQTDGKSVYVIVDGYEKAIQLQRKTPGAMVEPKGV